LPAPFMSSSILPANSARTRCSFGSLLSFLYSREQVWIEGSLLIDNFTLSFEYDAASASPRVYVQRFILLESGEIEIAYESILLSPGYLRLTPRSSGSTFTQTRRRPTSISWRIPLSSVVMIPRATYMYALTHVNSFPCVASDHAVPARICRPNALLRGE
jgi:hypothetical protein